jgi:hypothetical protein
MAKLNSVLRKTHFKERQLKVVSDIIRAYKTAGYRVIDGIETIMIEEPDSSFRMFISRISHVLQFYYLGEPDSAEEHYTKNLISAEEVVKLEQEYKQKFG